MQMRGCNRCTWSHAFSVKVHETQLHVQRNIWATAPASVGTPADGSCGPETCCCTAAVHLWHGKEGDKLHEDDNSMGGGLHAAGLVVHV